MAVNADPGKVPLAPLDGAVNVTITPLTGLLLASVTVACNAVANATFTFVLCPDPALAVILAGVMTTSVTLATCDETPEACPVMVSGYLPIGVDAPAVTVNEEFPEVSDDGAKLAVAPVGNPVTPSETEPLKLPLGKTLTVKVAVDPCVAWAETGAAQRAKPAFTNPYTAIWLEKVAM